MTGHDDAPGGNLLEAARIEAKRLLAQRRRDGGSDRLASILIELVHYGEERDALIARLTRQVGLLLTREEEGKP